MLIEKKLFTWGKLQGEETYNGSMSSYMCERILCLPVDSNQIILWYKKNPRLWLTLFIFFLLWLIVASSETAQVGVRWTVKVVVVMNTTSGCESSALPICALTWLSLVSSKFPSSSSILRNQRERIERHCCVVYCTEVVATESGGKEEGVMNIVVRNQTQWHIHSCNG